ncbi:MAG: 4-hydroxy-tetrahydrodipicolinate synthase [Christensenellaceae bacterium]|jgi:4-hydroxy-tetrahydrodipicolinate synthase|nr:4-hydroxy-tetrahydrodipicolinate synthase [Christensenellaceae bacterium]
MIFKGCATAIITPLTKDGSAVDFDSFKELIKFQLKGGVDALVFLGTTGAASTLSMSEREEIVRFALTTVDGRVPVIVGAGSNNTKDAIENSIKYQKLGADGLLHVTPYYNKCTQKGLVEHFGSIAEATTLPIILYNVPERTGLNMLPKTVEALSRNKSIVGLKEANSNIEQAAEIIKLCPKLMLYSGNDGMTLPIMSLGGNGVISVAGNIIPDIMSGLCEDFFEGKYEQAQKTQLKLVPLIKALFCETNPIPVQTALNLMGKTSSGFRLPLTDMSEENEKLLKKELKSFGLI